MRINKYVALATGISRRAADTAISSGRVTINGQIATNGANVNNGDNVGLDNRSITPAVKTTVLLNKPVGYVVSRDGQGSRTIYDLLPPEYHNLKPVGRLDKNSSGLLLITNDGDLAHTLTHPGSHKTKIYEIELNKPLQPLNHQMLVDHGIKLDDGISKFAEVNRIQPNNSYKWQVIMHEGRNRQIRRTFAALDYEVIGLHRTNFGPYQLDNLRPGKFKLL